MPGKDSLRKIVPVELIDKKRQITVFAIHETKYDSGDIK